MLAKLDSQTPRWKWPLWWWMTRLGAWPSAPEALASAFDFNRAPFFQSFVEVCVEEFGQCRASAPVWGQWPTPLA